MGIQEIPRSFKYTCDVCGKVDLQENASGHYTDSRPPHWTRLKLARTAYGLNKQAFADASYERLLCSGCSEAIDLAITSASEVIRRDKERGSVKVPA